VHRAFDLGESFRNGELLGFAFALFAASAGRWIAWKGEEGRVLRWLSFAGMGVVAAVSAVIWRDGYLLRLGDANSPLVPLSLVLYLSYAIATVAFITGVATEIRYAVTVQQSQVLVVS
jgi:hypothetical protein